MTERYSTVMNVADNSFDSPRPQIDLFKRDGATFSSITARLNPDGTLLLSGYDIGPICQEAYGHDDVESEVTVAREHKDKLLLALLKAQFAGDNQASSHFRSFLDAERIPYDFDTWP